MSKTERKYRIADRTIGITFGYEYTEKMCRAYEIFTEEEPEICICVNQEEIDRERGSMEEGFSDAYLESLAIYRKLCEAMLSYDTFLVHGSVIEVDGKAYLFTAPSGTGKSTHVRLWKQHFGEAAHVINDDKPLIQVRTDGIYVCGTPWCGKHGLNTNKKASLHAICILERGLENHITEIEPMEGYPTLFRQTYRPKNRVLMTRTLALLKQLAERVSLYRLQCNISEEAVKVAWEKMH